MTLYQPLTAPVTTNWDWRQQGACLGTGDKLFFHPPGERKHRRTKRNHRSQDHLRAVPGHRPVPSTRPVRGRAVRDLGRPVRR